MRHTSALWGLLMACACGRQGPAAEGSAGAVQDIAPAPLASVGGPAPPAAAAPLPGTPLELGGRSKAGTYQLTLRMTVPQVSELFAAEVRVSLASGAALPDGTTVTVDATMPDHRHGMMTQPVTAAVGPGQWRADGLKLHMQGHWVFAVDVRGPAGYDRLDLPFEQPPEAAAP